MKTQDVQHESSLMAANSLWRESLNDLFVLAVFAPHMCFCCVTKRIESEMMMKLEVKVDFSLITHPVPPGLHRAALSATDWQIYIEVEHEIGWTQLTKHFH